MATPKNNAAYPMIIEISAFVCICTCFVEVYIPACAKKTKKNTLTSNNPASPHSAKHQSVVFAAPEPRCPKRQQREGKR